MADGEKAFKQKLCASWIGLVPLCFFSVVIVFLLLITVLWTSLHCPWFRHAEDTGTRNAKINTYLPPRSFSKYVLPGLCMCYILATTIFHSRATLKMHFCRKFPSLRVKLRLAVYLALLFYYAGLLVQYGARFQGTKFIRTVEFIPFIIVGNDLKVNFFGKYSFNTSKRMAAKRVGSPRQCKVRVLRIVFSLKWSKEQFIQKFLFTYENTFTC